MKFMITFMHGDGKFDNLTPDDVPRLVAQAKEFQAALKSEKNAEMVHLKPEPEAKTVRKHSDGRLEVIDGPHRESPEQPGGFFIIEAESMEEALEWAKKGRWLVGVNEVREISDFSF